MVVKFKYFDDEIREGEVMKDKHFMGGYKVIQDNLVASIDIIELIDVTKEDIIKQIEENDRNIT